MPCRQGERVRGSTLCAVGAIFLRHGNTFIAMREQEYEAEDVLQALIAEHPEVLAGDEADVSSSWLLVKRETPVQSLSLDHLFLDREGVPTLVEVKRSSNTQLRREVVAQMLDYAANASTRSEPALVRASANQGRRADDRPSASREPRRIDRC